MDGLTFTVSPILLGMCIGAVIAIVAGTGFLYWFSKRLPDKYNKDQEN